MEVSTEGAAARGPADAGEVFAAHGDFLWATLQRLGVRDRDLADTLQEVLVVVMQRLHTYDPSRPIAPWLFGICMRVASVHRRRAYVRREQLVESVPEARRGEVGMSGAMGEDPEQAAVAGEGRARLQAILDAMDLEKRAVFVMFEVEGQSCEQIAATVGVPVGTVYSRLHTARQEFSQHLARWRARDAGPGGVR